MYACISHKCHSASNSPFTFKFTFQQLSRSNVRMWEVSGELNNICENHHRRYCIQQMLLPLPFPCTVPYNFDSTCIVIYTQVRTALLKMCRREKDDHPQSNTESGKTDAGSYAFLDVMWSKSSGSLTKSNDMAKLPLEVSACSTFQSALHPCCLGNFVCRFL